jgi:spectinomycin phosphotransferase
MTQHPPIDHDTLRALLLRDYGLNVRSSDYRPADWSIGGFTISTETHERYYLKVQEITPWTFAASSRDFYLPLTLELQRSGALPHVACPIPAHDGRLWTAHDRYALILQNYIDGTMVGHAGMTDEVVAEVAALIGRLHTSSVHSRLRHLSVEAFDLPFHATLITAAAAASTEADDARELDVALQAQAMEIRGYLDRLEGLQRKLRQARPGMVVCHTDLHGENLMVDREGNLYIVDWDNAMVAPREHDLMFFAGDERFERVFVPAYQSEAGTLRVDSDLLRFYYYRRGLEDVTDYIVRIRREDGDAARDRGDLADLLEILNELACVETTVVGLEAAGLSRQEATTELRIPSH